MCRKLDARNVVGAEVLSPIFTEFRRRSPLTAIDLALSNRNQDISRRDAGIVVRMVRPAQKALIAKRIGTIRIGFYAHRDYLARYGMLRVSFGIGDCQEGIALREPSLVPVLCQSLGFKLEMWLVMHEDLRGSRRTRLLFEFLAAALKTYAGSGKNPRNT
jgi:DNA-binding transcriptional LysR family regulator